VTVRPGEYGPDAAGRIAGVEGIQPSGRIAQLGGQRGQREAGAGGGAGGGDGQGQRQPGAQADQLAERDRL